MLVKTVVLKLIIETLLIFLKKVLATIQVSLLLKATKVSYINIILSTLLSFFLNKPSFFSKQSIYFLNTEKEHLTWTLTLASAKLALLQRSG